MEMMRKVTGIALLVTGCVMGYLYAPVSVVFANDTREEYVTSSVIEANMCIPAVSGIGCLHVDEDVSGLIVSILSCDGAQIALYDDPTEVEDIAVIGTYAAPSANNVRVSPQGNSGSDLTQMMFADSVYSGQECIVIDVSDGESTIMDYQRRVDIKQPWQ